MPYTTYSICTLVLQHEDIGQNVGSGSHLFLSLGLFLFLFFLSLLLLECLPFFSDQSLQVEIQSSIKQSGQYYVMKCYLFNKQTFWGGMPKKYYLSLFSLSDGLLLSLSLHPEGFLSDPLSLPPLFFLQCSVSLLLCQPPLFNTQLLTEVGGLH